MRLFHRIIPLVCLFAAIITATGEDLTAKAEGAVGPPAAAELQLLQGKWQGIALGDAASDKITITISSNSFHFYRDTNFWFETTITLPPGANPKQLHATIKGCPESQASSMGKIVGAIFKIEEGTLTLVTGGGGTEMPKSFEDTENKGLLRFELRKAQPPDKNTQSPKAK